jgi:cytochrome oxidase Cu insertion factor (SCO1/SenC/PrrC family)
MKYLFNVFYVGFLFAAFFSCAYGQQNDKGSIVFSGQFTNVGPISKLGKMYIFFDKNDYVIGSDSLQKMEVAVDSIGNFNFILPNLNKPLYVSIIVTNINGQKNWTKNFYADLGDDIKIYIDGGGNEISVKFLGHGSEKYMLCMELQRLFWKDFLKEADSLKISDGSVRDLAELKSKMFAFANLIRKFREKKAKLLGTLNTNSNIKEVITFGSTGGNDYDWHWAFTVSNFYNKNPKYREEIAQYYLSHKDEFYIKPNPLAIFAPPYYLQNLVGRAKLESKILSGSDKVNFIKFNDYIKSKYMGVIRDRLLCEALTSKQFSGDYEYFSFNTFDSLVTEAKKNAILPYVKKILAKKLESETNLRKKLINEDFSLLNGAKFSLESLKGKVILIDGWFEGCTGCAWFHADFKQIYPKFKDNDDFVVLSINADTDKRRWKSGLLSNRYSSDDFINVNAENGINHPFFKFYNVTGFSWVILVDREGNILPRFKSYEELASQITKALQTK